MTERKITGHTEGGGGLQNHSLGQYYPYASVILDCGDERWYGVMDTRTGHTLYFQTRGKQENALRYWSSSSDRPPKTKFQVASTWYQGTPRGGITYHYQPRMVFDVVCCDSHGSVIETMLLGYDTREEAHRAAKEMQIAEDRKYG